MNSPSPFRNKEYARQLNDFGGLRFGKIMPTDVDGFLDFWNKLFIFIESKHCGSPVPLGQKLALQRLADACHRPPERTALAIVVDHDCGSADVDLAETVVREVWWNNQWMPPNQSGIKLRAAIDEMLRKTLSCK